MVVFNWRLRLAGYAAAMAAMFLMAGGHWGALQTVAWAGMLRTYSQEDGSLLSGIKKTFGGDHPCTMCTSIKTGQESERTSPAAIASLKKLEAFPALCAPCCRCGIVLNLCFPMRQT